MREVLASIVLLFLLSGNTSGQSNNPNITPPTPNAAAFAKYGNTPVSPYTGVANVDIPLYEIHSRDIRVPISISYHPSGIRVGEEASRIGLGWVLNCGGLISRSIVNRDDLIAIPQALLSDLSDAPPIPQGPLNSPMYHVMTQGVYKNINTLGTGTNDLYLSSYLAPPFPQIDPLFVAHDFEPDHFTYNFPGHSGKFVLNKENDPQTPETMVVVMEKQEKMKIKPTRIGDNTIWEISTADGFTYKFSDYDYVVDTDHTAGYQQLTSWYLTEIISPQHEKVTFHYSGLGQQYIKPIGSFYERRNPKRFSPTKPSFQCRSQNEYMYAELGRHYFNLVLDSVTWSNGKLVVTRADDRQDLEGDIRYTGIQIFAKNALTPYQEIKFNQDYFLTSGSDGNTDPTQWVVDHPIRAKKRLRLLGTTRKSVPDNHQRPEEYSFSYYDDSQGGLMPPKNSFGQDHWGYPNGRGNTSLIPTYREFDQTLSITDYFGLMGTERNPDATYAKMFSLRSIRYPTGGTTSFYYELNDYEVSPSDPIASDGQQTYPETTSLLYDIANMKGTEQTKILDLTNEYVKNGVTVPVTLSAAFRTPSSCDQVSGTLSAYFELYDAAGNRISRVDPQLQRCSQDGELVCITCKPGSMVFDYHNTYMLDPGIYYWKAYVAADEDEIVDISAMYTWQVDSRKLPPQVAAEPDGTIIRYVSGGGLRVNKIEDYDPEGKITNVRRYDYHYKTEDPVTHVKEAHSYGISMVSPRYNSFEVSWQSYKPIGGSTVAVLCQDCLYVIRETSHPASNYDGTLVGYSKVREYNGLNGENGYTEYEYNNIRPELKRYDYPLETPGIYDLIPLKPPMNPFIREDKNGLLKSTTHFTAAGLKIQQTVNDYESKNFNIVYGVDAREMDIDAEYDGNLTSHALLFPYESVRSTFTNMISSITTNYLADGVTEGTKVSKYFSYDPALLLLGSETTFESNSNQTITSYTYPENYTDANSDAAILKMKGEKFMGGVPVGVTVINYAPSGSVVKSKNITTFGVVNATTPGDNGQFILPQATVSFESETPVAPGDVPAYVPATAGTNLPQGYRKVISLGYNGDGNLQSAQKADDLPVAYLWGYRNCLPIAEIKNAAADQSFHTSFEENGAVSQASGARTGVKVWNAASYTFPSSYSPNVAATVMSYWYWKDSKWNFSGVVPFQATINVAGASAIDEVRAFPKGAQMTTYTHIPDVGLSSQTDANNITTYFEYDGVNRLKLVRDNEKRIRKSYEYHYKN